MWFHRIFYLDLSGMAPLGKIGLDTYPVPMFRDAFKKLDRLEAEDLIGRLNPLLGEAPYDSRKTTILAMGLEFYPGARLLEIADHSVLPTRQNFIIDRQTDAVILDWTNGPIYRLNDDVPLQIDEKNIVDYVRFFFAFVRGRHGRFIIVENVDDVNWKDEPPPTARKAIASLIEPIKLLGIDKDGTFVLAVKMIFKDSLFKSEVKINAKGQVTLYDEQLIVEDIPVLDDTFGQ